MDSSFQSELLSELHEFLSNYKKGFANLQVWEVLAISTGFCLEQLSPGQSAEEPVDPEQQLELILVLLKNLLHIKDKQPFLHDHLLTVLKKSEMLDVLVVAFGHVSTTPCLRLYNALLLDILRGLLYFQRPAFLTEASIQQPSTSEEKVLSSNQPQSQSKTASFTQRHLRLGGIFSRVSNTGSAVLVGNGLHSLKNGLISDQKKKRKECKAKDFTEVTRESSKFVRSFLKDFVQEFLNADFNTLLDSVWRDIISESGTLSESDKLNYIWAISFFLNCFRLFESKKFATKTFEVSIVAHVLDMHHVNFILKVLEELKDGIKLYKDVSPGTNNNKQ
ncbi:uncharacterized protein LOC135142727 [Zophobas morio]|uniref:uncharacterized protein LOC135142727 n=1 Tax=Zophobas morio TaxID=2755281 RepID=UPI00308328D2